MSESVISGYSSEDVAQTIAIITQLKAENVELKRNFENLKILHIQLTDSHKNLQGRYSVLYDERNTVEKQYQSLCESWRVELEEKQKQLVAAQAQVLGPRDLELLRVKLLEEVESSYRAKCDNLTKEAESSHQAYLKLRRDYEELQNTYRSLEVRTVGEQEAHRLEHTALVRDLREKAAQLTAAQAKLASSDSALRALQRDLEAARYSATQMKQELEEVRRAKERAVVDRENAMVQADRKVKAAEEEAAQLTSFVESVTRKNRHLVQELAESQRSSEDLFAANVRLQNAQTQLQAQLDSAVRMAASERAALAAEHEEVARKMEERLAGLQGEVARRESAMSEMRVAAQEELTKVVATWEGRLAEERRAASERQRELSDERANAQERAAAQQRAAEERRREDEAALRQAQSEADAASREAEAQGTRADGLAKQLAEAVAETEALRKELAEAKGELLKSQLSGQQLVERRADLEARLRAAEEDAAQMRTARDALLTELDALRRDAEASRASAAKAAEGSRAAWAAEKAALAKRHAAALKELAARQEGELRKAKRKARGAQVAVAQLTDEVADLKFKVSEAKHVNNMSEVMFLSGGRSTSPYRDGGGGLGHVSYSPGSPGAGGGAFGYGYGRPTTAPSHLAGGPAPNVVIVAGGGQGGASSVAAAAAAGAAAASQQQHQGAGLVGVERGAGAEGAGQGAGLVDSALLSSIAALRQRQQQYMDAARLGLQA